jgi:hypothetical protein
MRLTNSRAMGALVAAAVGICSAGVFAQPVNNACSAPTAINTLGTFPFNTANATTDNLAAAVCNDTSPGNIFNDVWFCWTANYSGPVTVSTCGLTTLDTKIAIYNGCACPASPPIACVDDACDFQTEVSFSAVLGQQYLIRLGSFNPADSGSGSIRLTSGTIAGPITNPANNNRYYLLGPGSWTQGQQRAQALGGNLVTIDDAAENAWVVANVLNVGGTIRRGWIGLNDQAVEGTFVWASGSPSAYRNWAANEPNNFNNIEHFVEINGTTSLWNDNRDLPPPAVFAIAEVPAPTCVADFNGIDGVTVQDIFDFLSALLAGSSSADINGVNGVTVQDLFDFLELWNAAIANGCP